MSENSLPPAMLRLIDALAEKAAADYLSAEAASRLAANDDRTNPVPLPPVDRAA